jgi:hypothetical protein
MLNIQLFNNFAKQVGGGGNIALGSHAPVNRFDWHIYFF